MDKKAIEQLVLQNRKLAQTLELYTSFHLTKDEKREIAKQVDSIPEEKNLSEKIEELKKRYTTSYKINTEDSTWSPGFVNNLTRYYSDRYGFDPLARLKENFEFIKIYFVLKNKESLTDAEKEAFTELEGEIQNVLNNINLVFEEIEL